MMRRERDPIQKILDPFTHIISLRTSEPLIQLHAGDGELNVV